jgi:hypothetical protein
LPLRSDQQLCLEDGKAAVPEGFFGVKTREQWSAEGSMLVNVSDLLETHHHPDIHRLAESDSWMPHAAVLLDSVVVLFRSMSEIAIC